MRFSALAATAAAAALLGITTAIPTLSHVVHEKRDAPPKNWVKRSRLVERNGKVKLPMRIGMKQGSLDIGDDLLMEVSRHDSPKFGQWYTPEEVFELFAPEQESVDAVREWLESAGIAGHRIGLSVNKQWLQFDASATEVEDLLKTQYWEYEHTPSGSRHIGCDQYHVPAHIQHHIDYITPGLNLRVNRKKSKEQLAKRSSPTKGKRFPGPIVKGPVPSSFKSFAIDESSSLDDCDVLITPACIAALYNITQATKAAAGNELGIFEEGDYLSEQDLPLFFQTLARNIPLTTKPILEGIDGGTIPGDFAGLESALDFQVSYPIIYPQNSVLFQNDDAVVASQGEEEFVLGFLNTFLDAIDGSYCNYSAFNETGNAPIDPVYPDPNPFNETGAYEGQLQCGVYKPTNVISISYGDPEDDLPTNYQQRQCNEFMKLGLQGISIIVSSGDGGVSAGFVDDNNFDGCLGEGQVFNPDWPAGCPFITSVGATYLPPGASIGDNEVAVTRFGSGGGFSNIYTTASFQSEAVATYFATSDPPYPYYNTSEMDNPPDNITNGGIYNRGGRGYPDVSAIGDNVVVYFEGGPTIVGGTSASAPVFAAILTRINEERIAVNKSTVGFVNPTLYANPQVLHDITVGNNSGCGTAGFFAAEGWDPVTGLGTPNYPAMLELWLSLP